MLFKKFRDLILGVLTLALSGFYLYHATQIKTRPKLTPSYASAQIVPIGLGVLLLIVSVLCILQGVKKLKTADAGEQQQAEKTDIVAVVLTFALILIYVFLLPKAGFCLSTMLFLFCQIMVLAPKDKCNPVLFAIVAVVFTVLVFAIFRVGLQQLLPRGIIEQLIGF